MEMFDSVVIGCDPTALDVAGAIRGALELFRLRVHLYHLVQKRNVIEFLGGHIPESQYVVVAAHGCDPPEGLGVTFVRVVDKVDGKWQCEDYRLSPPDIEKQVHLPGRTVLALGCCAGRKPIADAFLRAGCRAYVGSTTYVDQDSCAMFAIAFFYHLLSHEREPNVRHSDRDAWRKAAAFDPAREGTGCFQYYGHEMPRSGEATNGQTSLP